MELDENHMRSLTSRPASHRSAAGSSTGSMMPRRGLTRQEACSSLLFLLDPAHGYAKPYLHLVRLRHVCQAERRTGNTFAMITMKADTPEQSTCQRIIWL